MDFASGSLALYLYLVEEGAAMIVESTIVTFFENQSLCHPYFDYLCKQLFLQSACDQQIAKSAEGIAVGDLIARIHSAKIRKCAAVNDLRDTAFVGEIVESL